MRRGKTPNWLTRSNAAEDAFGQQHQLRSRGEREINGARQSVLLNDGESPLGWLKSRKDRNLSLSYPNRNIRRRALTRRLLVRPYVTNETCPLQTIAFGISTLKIPCVSSLIRYRSASRGNAQSHHFCCPHVAQREPMPKTPDRPHTHSA
jgi:hypothetical protein